MSIYPSKPGFAMLFAPAETGCLVANNLPLVAVQRNNPVADIGYFGQYLTSCGRTMKRVSAAEAKNAFGRFIDLARRESVVIVKHNRPVSVAISFE